METENVPMQQSTERSRFVNCDEQAWLRNTITTAIQMSIALSKLSSVGADRALMDGGIGGVVSGAIQEVCHALGLKPEVMVAVNQVGGSLSLSPKQAESNANTLLTNTKRERGDAPEQVHDMSESDVTGQ